MKNSPPPGIQRKNSRSFFIFFLLAAILFSFSAAAFAEDKPTLEEIAKTDAAKLFVSKQYVLALEEFKKLEIQYPKSVLIKRYMASLYDSLRQWDDAVLKLEEVLRLAPDDTVGHQMLGDIYIKRAELDQAAEQFRWIAAHDSKTAAGKYAQKRLEEINRLRVMPKTELGKKMAVPDFMKSPPAQLFAKGKYKEALEGFDQLIASYPEDMLIRRFRGIALLRLGQTEQAVAAYDEALIIEPENVATHFYLGQAYLEQGKMEEARKEFQWVIAHDETSYRMRAQRAIFQTLGRAPSGAGKKWTATVTGGFNFDTNATFKSRDDTFKSPGDQNSFKFPLTISGTYRFYQKNRLSLTTDALYTHSLYNDFVYLQTFTSGLGVSALYTLNFFGKPAFINFREGATHTILRNSFYLWSNSVSTSFIVIPHKKFRTTLTHRFAYNQYETRGTNPQDTNRTGFSNTISTSNTYYLNDKRTFYTSFGYDFGHDDTYGNNYIKTSHGAQWGLHFPVVEKIELDYSFRYKDSNYPKFASGPPHRRDGQFTMTTTLERPLTKNITSSLLYTFDYTKAAHNTYEYKRHDFGAQLTLRY